MTRNAITVRDAHEDDVPDLLTMWEELRVLGSRLERMIPHVDADAVLGRLKLIADDPESRALVAVLDDRVVGMLGRRMLVVPAERLRLAELIDGRVWLDGDDGRLRAAARGLDELEARLTPHGFLRVNRHTLVNLRKVSELAPSFNRGLWVLVEGSDRHIPVSRRRVGALRTQLGL